MEAWLLFLGRAHDAPAAARLIEPAALPPGGALPLQLRHPRRWSRTDVTRVILGNDPAWADVVLRDEPLSIQREHVRFYLPHASPERADFRALKDCSILIDGQPQPPLAWVNLRGGETLQFGPWLFRYQWRG